MEYMIVIEKAKGNFSAYCPDLPGCISVGDTIEEIKSNMKDAIEFHLDTMRERGEKIPEPSVFEKVEVAV